MLRGELLTDVAALESLAPEWDALAVACAKPFCAPAWMLAWWRHVAPRRALLRAVAVRDDAELVALAPMYAQRVMGLTRYRVLGSGTSYRVEPLLLAGADDAFPVVTETLASADPRPDAIVFEGMSPDSRWPEQLQAAAGGRLLREKTTGAPVLPLEGRTYEQWMASKSKHFRQEAARQRRRLEERGAVIRMAETEEDLGRGLRALGELHHARWRSRGGSKVLTPGVERMLDEAGTQMLEGARFRLWTTEAERRIVSADVFLAAGGEVAGWLGGFDDSWGSASPSVQAMLAAIRDSFERGDRRVDLGGGEHDYKRRWGEWEDLLQWCTVLPAGPRHALTRLRLAPRRAYRAAANRIPPQARRRLDRALRRLTGKR